MARLILAFVFIWHGAALAAEPVDPAFEGTWKLEGAPFAVYWSVRADGVYRVHGPGANPRQVGHVEAKDGRWSVTSGTWVDSGTYVLADTDTWLVTGSLGTGNWTRVWAPASAASQAPAGTGLCGLVSLDEVAAVLRAPVTGGPDPRVPEGCMYRSQLSDFDQLTIDSGLVSPPDWQKNRQRPSPRKADLPDIGDGAYAELDAGNHLVARVLRGDQEYEFRLTLVPDTTLDDAPPLADLARAALARLDNGGQSGGQ